MTDPNTPLPSPWYTLPNCDGSANDTWVCEPGPFRLFVSLEPSGLWDSSLLVPRLDHQTFGVVDEATARDAAKRAVRLARDFLIDELDLLTSDEITAALHGLDRAEEGL